MTDKLRWGLLSTADINKALLEPLRKSRRNTLQAVASRDRSRAEAYARKHKVPRAHGSYEDLLADPAIDVIYNPLPNSLHAEWTLKALQAGKHVLCEKPLALSVEEVNNMAAASKQYGKVVMEALMYRCHAQIFKVRELVRGGKLGRVRLVRGSFTYPGCAADNYRLKPELGGGCLWDVGIYPLGFTRFVLEAEPLEVFGWQTPGPTGVDEAFAAQLRFPGDIHLQMDTSMALPHHVFMEFVGDEAALVVPQPFNPGRKEALYRTRKANTETIKVFGEATYVGEVEAMADAILEGKPPAVPLDDSRRTVAAIQALFESARSGKPVSLS
jgi:D-xylose 1-dehydrogenase (NADP+, D-xylono-1,5-lactone-forming)